MTCNNMTTQYVPKGWTYVERPIKCGNTLINGERAICEECANDAMKRHEIELEEARVKADNEASHSAGWGDW